MKNGKGKKSRSLRRKIALGVTALDLMLSLMWMGTLVTYRGTELISVAVKGWGLKELDAGLMYFLQLFVCAAKITFGLFLLGAVAQESYVRCRTWIQASFVLMVPILIVLANDIFYDLCVNDVVLDLLILLGQSVTTVGVINYTRKLPENSLSIDVGKIRTISVVINDKEKASK